MANYKYRFFNDYSEMAHPKVLEALSAVGETQFEGYGLDEFSARAGDIIKVKIKKPSADVHFAGGGTHSNLIVISSALRPYEAVIAPESGHVSTHETGAIEATGHKICAVKGKLGKLSCEDIQGVIAAHTDEHMVKPRLVYISQSTEHGTVYKKAELTAVSECCRKHGLYLFIDGARLGAALNSSVCDMTYQDIAELADAFTIGGTKNGALFGEAIVICNDKLKTHFRFHLKQKGALLAKGAAMGVQYAALLSGGLYDELASHSNTMASKLGEGIKKLGYDFLYPAETNQIFPLFPADIAAKMHKLYGFHDWESSGGMTAVRIVTSWATPENKVDDFIADLELNFRGCEN